MVPSITMIIYYNSKKVRDKGHGNKRVEKLGGFQPTSSTLHPVFLHFFSVFLSLPLSQFHFPSHFSSSSTLSLNPFSFFFFFTCIFFSRKKGFLPWEKSKQLRLTIAFCFSSSQLTPNSIP